MEFSVRSRVFAKTPRLLPERLRDLRPAFVGMQQPQYCRHSSDECGGSSQPQAAAPTKTRESRSNRTSGFRMSRHGSGRKGWAAILWRTEGGRILPPRDSRFNHALPDVLWHRLSEHRLKGSIQ